MPPLPSPHAAAALLLTIVAFALFASNRFRIELICLSIIGVLALGFYVFPLQVQGRFTGMEVAFGGFSNQALVAICCLMIIARGLVVTGALEPAAHALTRMWRFNRTLGMLCTLVFATCVSMFVNDTPVMVMTLPILLALGERASVAPSKTLMPVNCAILIGGMSTTLGTSTNLLVLGIAADLGVQQPGVFAFTQLSLTAALVALPYLWLIMPRLLPAHEPNETETPRRYDAALHFTDSSSGIDSTLASLRRKLAELRVVALTRQGHMLAADDGVRLAVGDRLHVNGPLQHLREASQIIKAPLAEPSTLAGIRRAAEEHQENQRIVEMVIGTESPLRERPVNDAHLANHYGIAVLGAWRSSDLGGTRGPIAERLDVGDVVLVQGTPNRLKELTSRAGVHLLDGGEDLPHTAKAPLALVIAAGVILLAAFKVLPIAISALAGTIAMLATGCLQFDRIGRALSLQVIVLIAASIALGRALVETGAAQWLGILFAAGLHGLPPAAVLVALMVFAAVLTNFVSNAAAAAIGTPLAVSLAQQLHIAPEPLILAILFGCNLSYVTPIANHTNMLIMGAARYHFRDFVRAGLPLTVLMIVTLVWLLAHRYGLG